MPILFAASRPATATLSQIRYLNPDSCINLHRPTQIDTSKTTSSSAARPSANAFDPVASDHMPHPRRSNPHSVHAARIRLPLPAVSSLGGFRTPAASARGTVHRGRHPKTFTGAETQATGAKRRGLAYGVSRGSQTRDSHVLSSLRVAGLIATLRVSRRLQVGFRACPRHCRLRRGPLHHRLAA